MGFDDLLRTGVALAASLTADGLQATVQHKARTGVNEYGEPAFGAATPRAAIVIPGITVIRDAQGQDAVATCHVIFLGDVAIGSFDQLALPDGSTPRILRVDSGPLAQDGGRYLTQVWLG